MAISRPRKRVETFLGGACYGEGTLGGDVAARILACLQRNRQRAAVGRVVGKVAEVGRKLVGEHDAVTVFHVEVGRTASWPARAEVSAV